MKAIIKTPTPDRNKSLKFYEYLEYKVVNRKNPTLISDSKIVIEIDPDRFARAGITFYKDSWDKELEALHTSFSVLEKNGAYITADPNGVTIYLKNIKDYPHFQMPENHKAITGNFAGISIESLYLEKSVEFWSIFGYKITMGSKENGWIAMSNETSIGISIMVYNMCPHLFYNPSFTYFNGNKNPQIIEKIRNADIEITEEITHFNKKGIVDNIIIRDPGGYGFFIFND